MEKSNLKTEIIDYIAEENRAFFKLQQIDDPEITLGERKKILEQNFEQSHSKFLMRYGSYLKLEHLAFFDNPQNYSDEEQYEIEFYLKLLKRSNLPNDVTVKNRRYEAMKQLKEEGNYFSEIEMMKREPLLYHEFVGQYLTQSEIKIRDEENSKSFLNIIFATIDHNTANELKRKQENEILMSQPDDLCNKSDNCKSTDDRSHPPAFQKLWGEFDDNLSEQRFNAQFTQKVSSITNEQRNFLRAEFISIMQSKFLSGSDEDFDYTTVDLNQNYDNLEILSRDEEDKYFDSEDAFENTDKSPPNGNISEEDELDIFMETLNNSLK